MLLMRKGRASLTGVEVPQGRPSIPSQLRRDVLIEAGYRCAMPRCGAQTVEIHHIVDYATAQEHTFGKLIALCPTCHARVTKGEIDRKAISQIKADLAMNVRYSDLERRMLRAVADRGLPAGHGFTLPGGLELMMMYAVSDGLFDPRNSSVPDGMFPSHVTYVLTEKGRAFVDRWLSTERSP